MEMGVQLLLGLSIGTSVKISKAPSYTHIDTDNQRNKNVLFNRGEFCQCRRADRRRDRPFQEGGELARIKRGISSVAAAVWHF